jgi:hypothetical protein
MDSFSLFFSRKQLYSYPMNDGIKCPQCGRFIEKDIYLHFTSGCKHFAVKTISESEPKTVAKPIMIVAKPTMIVAKPIIHTRPSLFGLYVMSVWGLLTILIPSGLFIVGVFRLGFHDACIGALVMVVLMFVMGMARLLRRHY